jgi:hypothetical protein
LKCNIKVYRKMEKNEGHFRFKPLPDGGPHNIIVG